VQNSSKAIDFGMANLDNISDSVLPEQVLFYGRTLKEYVNMFDLELSDWKSRKILDCPAGPASFVVEARRQGFDVVGCDPLYSDNLQEELLNSGNAAISKTINICSAYSQYLSQKFYSSLEEMQEYATSALTLFAESYGIGRNENWYIQAALPNLPFSDQSFDLVLCGSFLFIYSAASNQKLGHLDYGFHYQAIRELMRVCRGEIRIFPIPSFQEKLHEYAERLLTDLEQDGIVIQTIPVEYEVFKKGNLMWRLTGLS
jgi:hypothetical protein